MTKPRKRAKCAITEERILQISNDVSEDEVSATKEELIETVRYWQGICDEWNKLHQKRISQVLAIMVEHTKEPHPMITPGLKGKPRKR